MAAKGAQNADGPALLAAAQRGDQRAQAAIFTAHRHQVARRVQRITGDSASVDDLVQEVFIAAFSALPSFRGDAQLHTWLYTIALNKARNWWDRARRRRIREQQAGTTHDDRFEQPDNSVEAEEHRERLYSALAGLSNKLREAFTARAIESLSLQEASEVLGVPVSTVSYRTRRAERLLCEALSIPWDAEDER